MDDRLWFDVFAVMTDPPWRVEHEAYERRVSVVIGHLPGESSSISLWFKDPDVVVTLGRELTTAGTRLAAQLRTPRPDSDHSVVPSESGEER